jgi:hypothetical protein
MLCYLQKLYLVTSISHIDFTVKKFLNTKRCLEFRKPIDFIIDGLVVSAYVEFFTDYGCKFYLD